MSLYLLSLHSVGGSFSEAIEPIYAVAISGCTFEEAEATATYVTRQIEYQYGDDEVFARVTVLDTPDVASGEGLAQALLDKYEEVYGD